MKKTLTSIALIILTFSLLAQENKSVDLKKDFQNRLIRTNEIGVLGQVYFGQNQYPGSVLFGVNYKRKINSVSYIRALGGFAPYNEFKELGIESINQDTVIRNYYTVNIASGFLGIGIEVERQFYKKVHLFAALELLGGYGSGKLNYIKRASIFDKNIVNHLPTLTYQNIKNYKIAFLNFNPSIGAKIVCNKLNFGVELNAMQLSNKIAKTESQNSWTIASDFNLLGASTFRTFVNYRF